MGLGTNCLGCKLANKEQPIYSVYEDDYVTCLLDHMPFNEGHTLILPKKHYMDVDDLDTKTANAIMSASKLISKSIKTLYQPDGITICQNGGIFNELTHYHMHIVPRYKNQSFADFHSTIPENIEEPHALAETSAKLKKVLS
jgi:diadenosine tetraphosphate (Ap4A) HIT family hydrolase